MRSIKYYVLCIMGILFFVVTILHTTSYILPVHAQAPSPGVDIGKHFGFGDIKSLGEGTSRLVMPIFELTAAVVIIYFLIGAFLYLKAGGSKEEVQKAKNMITHAIIGFIVLIFAFFLIDYILGAFGVTFSIF